MSLVSFNLLDPENQQSLRLAYGIRFLKRMCAACSIVLAVLLVLLISIFMYLATVRNAQESLRMILEKDPQLTQAKGYSSQIRQAQTLITGAETALAQDEPLYSVVVRKLIAALPQGVTLDSFTMTRSIVEITLPKSSDAGGIPVKQKVTAVTIDLSGTAATRADVQALERALRSLGGFVDLNSPISNIVASHNGVFQMKLIVR